MPNIHEINTSVYRLLAEDAVLAGLCRIYKGSKRPVNVQNPSMTVDTRRLEPGDGEGIWMCNVVVTTYTDVFSNRVPDHEKLDEMVTRICELLIDTEIELDGGKALPLIREESSEPKWDEVHNNEVMQETTFGLILIKFR